MTADRQPELPLPAPPLPDDQPLLPARMVNEYVYCPRLAYLEWVQGEWAESADTLEGSHAHRRVDRPGKPLLPPEALDAADPEETLKTRSVTLASQRLGLIAKIDLLETAPAPDLHPDRDLNIDTDGEEVTVGRFVVPVDVKRGKRPHVAGGAYDPERIQLCVQALLLEEQGYRCREGALYFAGSRERIRVVFDEALRAATLEAVNGLRLVAAGGRIPPPLRDSPKCPRCALVGICLPDEVNFLTRSDLAPRPIAVPGDTALPLYVQAQRARIAKRGETLEIAEDEGPTTKARLIDLSQVVLFGNVSITTPCLHELMRREIPVTWHSYGGWFLGHTVGTGHKNVEVRTAQYRFSFDEAACLRFARGLVQAKIRNGRTLLRRNWRGGQEERGLALERLQRLARQAWQACDPGVLLGCEGEAAAIYFRNFAELLRPEATGKAETAVPETDRGAGTALGPFHFERRTRRPPADPINALLSFAYALLARTWSVTLSGVGLDPYRGFYHRPRYGRPALALDMMEPYRPIVADSVVVQAINNGEVKPVHFLQGPAGCALTPAGRKAFIAAFERRLSQETTHPLFGYRLSLRRLLEVQARLLARHLLGEIDDFPHYLPR